MCDYCLDATEGHYCWAYNKILRASSTAKTFEYALRMWCAIIALEKVDIVKPIFLLDKSDELYQIKS